MPRSLLLALALLAAGCGPRQPPAKPGDIMIWKVMSSDIKFSQCTDDPSFREEVKAIEFEPGRTFLIYRMDADGKTATAMTCDTLDRRSCVESASGVVYQVAGTELLFARESKAPIGTEGCFVQSAQSWVLTDRGESLDMLVTETFSLVDDAAACGRVEDQVKSQSPNKLGLQGCVVTYTVSTVLN